MGTPGDAEAYVECFDLAVPYVGSIYESYLTVYVLFPERQQWQEGERTVSCVVAAASGAKRSRSARDRVEPGGRPADERNIDGLNVGDCFEVNGVVTDATVARLVDCTAPHSFELYAAVPVEEPSAGRVQAEERAADICVGEFMAYVGRSCPSSSLDVIPSVLAMNKLGDIVISCALVAQDGSDLVGSMQGSRR